MLIQGLSSFIAVFLDLYIKTQRLNAECGLGLTSSFLVFSQYLSKLQVGGSYQLKDKFNLSQV